MSSILDMLKLGYLLDSQVEMSRRKLYIRLVFREEVQAGNVNEHIVNILMVFNTMGEIEVQRSKSRKGRCSKS